MLRGDRGCAELRDMPAELLLRVLRVLEGQRKLRRARDRRRVRRRRRQQWRERRWRRRRRLFTVEGGGEEDVGIKLGG